MTKFSNKKIGIVNWKIENSLKTENCKLKILAILLFVFLSFNLALAVEDGVQVTQTVTGCNNDGVCAGLETFANCPADCEEEETPPSGGGGPIGDKTLPGIYDLVVITTDNSASISWKTTEPARSTIYWGLTEEYEMGTISEVGFLEEHKAILTGLSPDTVYHFQFFLRDEARNEYRSFDQQFRTLVESDDTPPSNVSNFTATRIGEEEAAGLSWKNPTEADFAGVRIVRSTKFFPVDIYDGTTIYEGPGESAKDYDIETGITYYYTAFAYDTAGNYSSGAVALFLIREPGVPIVVPPVIPPVVPPEKVPLEIEKIKLDFFDFFQGGKKVPFVGEKIYLDGSKPLNIKLDYEKAPEILKTILVTLVEPSDEEKTFSFLLKVNKDGSAYEAKLGAFEVPGLYEVSIAILDYENQALKKIKTFFFVEGEIGPADGGGEEGEESRYFHGWWGLWPMLLLILIIIISVWYLIRKRRKQEQF